MDFGALPPEINSARMYAGPGAGSMLAAASAWGQLAHELNSSGAAYGSVIMGLTTSGWRGRSSMMMADAIAPYVAWLHNTAAHAEQTSVQATTAADAYQTAFSMTVAPPLIEANRTQLTALVASNFFGQNSPAIAATEADYNAMWAQDTAAMYGYAASASTASKLTPFSDPPGTTDAAGQAAQTAAFARCAASPAQTASTPQVLAQLPTALQQLAAPAAAAAAGAPATALIAAVLAVPSAAGAAASLTSASFSGSSIGVTNNSLAINAMRDDAQGIGPFPTSSTAPVAPAGSVSLGGPTVSAAMGRASLVGTLSVPQTWAATAPPAINPMPPNGVAAASGASETMPGESMFGEALLGTLAGRGVSTIAAKMRTSVIPRSPAAG